MCYDTPFNEELACQELRDSTVSYSAKSRSNLLQLILEHDADKVLTALTEWCAPECLVPALLREYGEGLTRVKSRLLTSRVGHVTLSTLAKHSKLIGQLIIDNSNAEQILVSVRMRNTLIDTRHSLNSHACHQRRC